MKLIPLDQISGFYIGNQSDRDVYVYIYKKDRKVSILYTIVSSNEFKIIFSDLNFGCQRVEWEDIYFQFEGMKRKIKVKNAYKHKIILREVIEQR
jgi:hypothetical protein